MYLEMAECHEPFFVTMTLVLTADSIKLFWNMVTFHIQLKGMKYTTAYKQNVCPYAHP